MDSPSAPLWLQDIVILEENVKRIVEFLAAHGTKQAPIACPAAVCTRFAEHGRDGFTSYTVYESTDSYCFCVESLFWVPIEVLSITPSITSARETVRKDNEDGRLICDVERGCFQAVMLAFADNYPDPLEAVTFGINLFRICPACPVVRLMYELIAGFACYPPLLTEAIAKIDCGSVRQMLQTCYAKMESVLNYVEMMHAVSFFDSRLITVKSAALMSSVSKAIADLCVTPIQSGSACENMLHMRNYADMNPKCTTFVRINKANNATRYDTVDTIWALCILFIIVYGKEFVKVTPAHLRDGLEPPYGDLLAKMKEEDEIID